MSAWDLKPGVVSGNLTTELSAALDTAKALFVSFGQPFTVTSLSEGQHVPNSKHYIGQAADLRTRDVDPATIPTLISSLKANLGPGYTVINEGDHIHVQYNGIGTPLYLPSNTLPSDTPLEEVASGGFNLDQFFSDLAARPQADYQESGISGGLLVGLILGGVALFLIIRD